MKFVRAGLGLCKFSHKSVLVKDGTTNPAYASMQPIVIICLKKEWFKVKTL
jgi:hypothetical protein